MIIIAAAEQVTARADTVVAVLGAGGLGAVLAAVVTGVFTKRKLGAEATEIITKAAAGVVTNLQSEIQRQTGIIDTMRSEYESEIAACESKMTAMARAHVAERDEWKRVLQLHVSWDAIALAKMADIGIELPPVPPLMPPKRYVDDDGMPIV